MMSFNRAHYLFYKAGAYAGEILGIIGIAQAVEEREAVKGLAAISLYVLSRGFGSNLSQYLPTSSEDESTKRTKETFIERGNIGRITHLKPRHLSPRKR